MDKSSGTRHPVQDILYQMSSWPMLSRSPVSDLQQEVGGLWWCYKEPLFISLPSHGTFAMINQTWQLHTINNSNNNDKQQGKIENLQWALHKCIANSNAECWQQPQWQQMQQSIAMATKATISHGNNKGNSQPWQQQRQQLATAATRQQSTGGKQQNNTSKQWW